MSWLGFAEITLQGGFGRVQDMPKGASSLPLESSSPIFFGWLMQGPEHLDMQKSTPLLGFTGFTIQGEAGRSGAPAQVGIQPAARLQQQSTQLLAFKATDNTTS